MYYSIWNPSCSTGIHHFSQASQLTAHDELPFQGTLAAKGSQGLGLTNALRNSPVQGNNGKLQISFCD